MSKNESSPQTGPSEPIPAVMNRERYPRIAAVVRPYSQSPVPVWSIAGLFFGSAIIPPSPFRPHLLYRLGFGAIFSGAGYVLFTGDEYNGSGITTAWSLTYLLLNLKKSLTTQRSALSLALSGASLASAALYGSEYFLLQESNDEN